jgi:two-component system chemotaxis response regulator CheB
LAPPRIDLVAIGASTGGPAALTQIFAALPDRLPVPIVIVQHMPPGFTAMLAETLTHKSFLTVEEGRSGGVLKAGHAWLAPGGQHMTVARAGGRISVELNQGPFENSVRPAADVLFRSVAAIFGARTLAVVLTGMGQDGLRGCQQIREAGGQILAQDEASSVVWGMPGAVVKAGLAHQVLGLEQIGAEISRRVLQRSSVVPGGVT